MKLTKLFISLSLFSAFTSMHSMAENNVFRFGISSGVNTELPSSRSGDAPSGSVSPDNKVYANWLDFYHDNQRHLSLENENQLNGTDIDLGGLQLSSRLLPDMRYPYDAVANINLNDNAFSSLDFLYAINDVGGSIDISGNTGLTSIDALANLNVANGNAVIFDEPSQYANLMDSNSPLCNAIISGNVTVKSKSSTGLDSRSAGEFCAFKDAWISAYHTNNYHLGFSRDSQLLNQLVSLNGATWTDTVVPDYNYPVTDIKSTNFRNTELTNVDFMKSVKQMNFYNETVYIDNNPNLVNLDGLGGIVMNQKWETYSQYGAESHTYPGRSVTIANNPSLESLSGVTNLYDWVGKNAYSSMTITNNPNLTSMPDFRGFRGGKLNLRNNPSLTDFSFLSSMYYIKRQSYSNSATVYTDAGNMITLPHAEDGGFCRQLLDRKIGINDTSGINAVRQYCQLNPWPDFFVNKIRRAFSVNGSQYWPIKDNEFTRKHITLENIDVTGILPNVPFPEVSTIYGINMINVTGLTDLSFFSSVTGASELNIKNNPDLLSINGVQNIETLDESHGSRSPITIDANPLLEDISALSHLQNVYALTITNNNSLASLSGLENIKTSQNVRLSNNAIVDISPISGIMMDGNNRLYLNNNDIATIPFISSTPVLLYYLDLRYNRLTSIENLRGHGLKSTGNSVLKLNGNPNLRDLSPLSEMPDSDTTAFIYIDDLSQYTTLLDVNGSFCQRAMSGAPSDIKNVRFRVHISSSNYYDIDQTSEYSAICK